MSYALREYLLTIIAACLLLTLMQNIIPDGTVKKVGGMIGGLAVILATVSPVAKIDTTVVSQAISEYGLKADAMERGIEIGSRELMCQVIREKCQSYILDKARSMGMELSVEITLNEDADYPYPIGALIQGTWSPAEQKELSRYVLDGLGIPLDRQEWIIT